LYPWRKIPTTVTWILGSGVMFGYGALISDVRATWPDGRHLDALQKVYPVGNWMMAGFAGSVEFGFQTIVDMERAFGETRAGYAWAPQIAAWRWYRRARRAFARAPARIQSLSSSILLVGVSPCTNGLYHWTRCIRMRSPSFTPELGRPPSWMSIGTGATHEIAGAYAAQDLGRFWETHAKGEIMNPGGAAFSTATAVALHLGRNPLALVSSQLQVGTVWQDKHVINTLDGQLFGPAWSSWKLVQPQGLATSWDEFRRITTAAGLSATAAAT
jgi:hypothetical protein